MAENIKIKSHLTVRSRGSHYNMKQISPITEAGFGLWAREAKALSPTPLERPRDRDKHRSLPNIITYNTHSTAHFHCQLPDSVMAILNKNNLLYFFLICPTLYINMRWGTGKK